MMQALQPGRRRWTVAFLVVSALAIAGALALGLDGNRPANLLALGASAAAVLAFVHPWRRPRAFLLLAAAAVVGFAVMAVLHNVFDAAHGAAAGVPVLSGLLQVLSVAAFLAAVFLGPGALVVGLVGALASFLGGRRGGRHRAPV